MSVLGRFTQQPGETLDYDVDFAPWFEGRLDAPASQAVVIDGTGTVVSSTRSGFVVRVVLSGGPGATRTKVTVRLTTTGGITREADFLVSFKES